MSIRQNRQHSRTQLEALGMAYGFLAVLGFSLTLPATRVAVADLDPIVVALGRALVAGILAAVVLWVTRQPLPSRQHLKGLLIVAAGVVLGFPLLSSWAMNRLPAAHGAVVLGLLPLATAIASVIRAGEQPSLTFWVTSAVGSFTVVSFGLITGAGELQPADIALLAAVVAAALGYAEGGRLARIMGGWQVISWALVLTSPLVVLPIAVAVSQHNLTATPIAWLGFGYVSVISQFLAFFAWYEGMSIGGVARVSQLQLLQPFLTILASALLLGEQITPIMLGAACIVIASVALGKQSLIKYR